MACGAFICARPDWACMHVPAIFFHIGDWSLRILQGRLVFALQKKRMEMSQVVDLEETFYLYCHNLTFTVQPQRVLLTVIV